MEHKQKVLATATSPAQGACTGSMIDRFSNLPDEIAHQILSRVDLKVLTRVGSLSKRCKGFYLSTPSFRVRLNYHPNRQVQLDFLSSFDRFLIYRGDNKMQHFTISLDLCQSFCHMSRVIAWIHIAARCNVEVLHVDLNILEAHSPTVELPSCIFLCESLRSLSLDFEAKLKLPYFVGFTSLQCLHLTNVKLDQGFSKWVSCSCSCIKELQLSDVSVKNLTIESSSLESFSFEVAAWSKLFYLHVSGEKLVDIHINWVFYEPGSRSFTVCAPNLKCLKWSGKSLNHHDLGKPMWLERAEIFLNYKRNDYDFDNACEVLCSLCRVKVLIICEDATKTLFREGSMPPPFDNLSYLTMHIGGMNDELVPAMVSLLRAIPNLTTLDIHSYPSFYKPKSRRFNRRYWKSQNLAFVDHIQDVTIELSNGSNGLEFARYILKHARNLEKMVLVHLPHQTYVTRRINRTKMVSTARVVVEERRPFQE